MRLVLVGRGRSTRSATGGGCNGSLFCAWKGRGIDGPPPASALLYGFAADCPTDDHRFLFHP